MNSIWHPLKNMNYKANIKYDKAGKAVEIKYADGYKVLEQSYIEDILIESGVITDRTDSWITN